MLGIDNERALRLLHKTQSAKNLGDLNVFMRDFMLDEPETFSIAGSLVNEFGELNEAHQEVVAARKKIETLKPARDEFMELDRESNPTHCQGSLLTISIAPYTFGTFSSDRLYCAPTDFIVRTQRVFSAIKVVNSE